MTVSDLRSIALSLTVTVVAPLGGRGQTMSFRPLTPTQFSEAKGHFDPHLIPPGMSPDLNSEQAFHLAGDLGKGLAVIDVQYAVPNQPYDEAGRHCGLYFLDDSGSSYLVTILGPPVSKYPICLQTEAVGVMHNEGPHPRMLVEILARAPSGTVANYPFVLRWDPKRSRYSLDDTLSKDLLGEVKNGSLTHLRDLLAHRGRQASQ